MPGPSLALPDPATVAVAGGGPAGSFFAIRLLRRARQLGRTVHVIILEKKSEICFYQPVQFCSWEGCNYCAGGISPRLTDILRDDHIVVPEEVIESRPTEITVHGDWKSIQLPVTPDREMLSVFRGSRPRQRSGRYTNFDTFLLHFATDEGAEVIAGEVTGVRYSAGGRPVLSYRTAVDAGSALPDRTLEADFAAFTSGVNRNPGMSVLSDPLFVALREMIPRLRPPRVRKAVIAELMGGEDDLRSLDGEMHFMQYGSKDLHIEMASLMPKRDWITAVLLGKSVDRAEISEYPDLVRRFVALPHIRRLLPPDVDLKTGCSCHPNVTVGAAKNPFGARVALAGDLAVSRLYKDGLYSAHVTATALADCVLDRGIDRRSLAKHYGPVVREFDADNRYGRVIFRLSHWVFARPSLSRILYQAVLTERKGTIQAERRLALVLWHIASGDDAYRRILGQMLHPASLWLILSGGLLITIRNQITERLFGLDWTGVGRYSTGVPLEDLERTRKEMLALQGVAPATAEAPVQAPGATADATRPHPPEMERMYTIRIRAGREAIMRQLGAFGDPERQYLRPRFFKIRRTEGSPNQVGTVIRYDVPLLRMSFHVGLEKAEPARYLLYRVLDGMGRGGILAFVLDGLKPGVSLLTIYVGFDFPRGHGLGRLRWWMVRRIFPKFAHDVVWNHALCEIKHLAEEDRQ